LREVILDTNVQFQDMFYKINTIKLNIKTNNGKVQSLNVLSTSKQIP